MQKNLGHCCRLNEKYQDIELSALTKEKEKCIEENP